MLKKDGQRRQCESSTKQEDDNEFTKDIKIQLSKNGFMCNRECKSQLDTTNFISIIKSKIVPINLISKIRDGCYEGINGSALEILVEQKRASPSKITL